MICVNLYVDEKVTFVPLCSEPICYKRIPSFMFGLSFPELMVAFLVAVIFIGPKQLPELGKKLGNLMRTWRSTKTEIELQIKDSMNPVEKRPLDKPTIDQPHEPKP